MREHLGEEAELLERDSALLGRARAATALLAGGLDPQDVAAAVRHTRARVVHAHNLLPSLGWRALAAARDAGARVVLHLHNYRLICAVATCFTHGEDCTRCQGRNTVPGVRLNCRGSRTEAAAYAASLSLWQRRILACADEVVVPSRSAYERLRELRAPFEREPEVLPHVVREFADGPRFDPTGPALVASRLAPEKGVEVAIEACRAAGVPLVVAGDGPERARLEALAGYGRVEFLGVVSRERLGELRAASRVELVPTRAAETFGLSAAEAMAAGLPVLASRGGALAEIVPEAQLVPPGDARALGDALRQPPDAHAASAAIARISERCAPSAVAARLAAVYA